jgi:hypothetical protein
MGRRRRLNRTSTLGKIRPARLLGGPNTECSVQGVYAGRLMQQSLAISETFRAGKLGLGLTIASILALDFIYLY